MPGSTSRLSLYKPGGGSTGLITPDEVADIDKLNDNFDDIDAAVGAFPCTSATRPSTPFQGQLIRESDTGKVLCFIGSDWLDVAPGIILIGNTAQRDAAYPTPGSAAARVALANKIVRFFNTDKGWEEQYFAQYDDSGATAATPVAETFGWKPRGARIPIVVGNVAVGGGVGTIQKRGNKVVITGAHTITIDEAFPADFDEFEIEWVMSAGSSDSSLFLAFRAAGATVATANYLYGYREISPAGSTDVAVNTAQNDWLPWRNSSVGGRGRMVIREPRQTARRKFMEAYSTDATNYTRLGGGSCSIVGTAFDGFRIFTNSAVTFTGELRVFGITNPR